MSQLSLVSRGLADLPALAQQLLNSCIHLRIFAFSGDLGAGKTTFIKHLCQGLGVVEPVTSPTFSLVNEYRGETGPIYHFDLYRLEDEEEAYGIGMEEYLDSGNYCLIEWPERIPSLLPAESAAVEIAVDENHHRHLQITFPPNG